MEIPNEGVSVSTNMTLADYHANPAIGSSSLKLALDSLAKLRAKLDGRIPDKKSVSMDIGTSAHAAVLEQDFSQYVCGPNVDKRTKAWKEFVAENENKIVLKPDDYMNIEGMFAMFFAHDLASRIITGGIAEESFFVNIEGVTYKARPDYRVVSETKGQYIVDYKTARSCQFGEFQRAIANYGYDTQAAHYMRVVGEATGQPVEDYFWIVQETEAPFEVAIYRADQSLLERATARCNRAYKEIGTAFATGVYPTREPARILDIDMPAWAIKENDNE